MHVVVSDIDAARVEGTLASLPGGTSTLGVTADVSDPASVDRMAEEAYRTFGATHLLCNNAGVSPLGKLWQFTSADWDWLLGVNVRGVANGIRSFVPRMVESGEDGHVLNTGSGGSFQGQSLLGAYNATKHAILGLTDSLRLELASSRIGVSLLCPGGVNTNIFDSLNRRSSTDPEADLAANVAALVAANDEATNTLVEPEVVAALALWGVREDLPYIVCAPGQKARVEQRFAAILDAHDAAARHDPQLP
jgi:NAD(P)-dependent dehydrogenase (short-subunit alcohol dehydrogenase family)